MTQEHRHKPNQLSQKLTTVLGLTSFDPYNSASRKQMFSSHISQALVISGATEKSIQSGMEQEYGKYTFSKTIPVNADIIRVIPRYRQTIDADTIKHNPETLVIYEDAETKEIGCISLVDFHSNHPYFGFAFKNTPDRNKVRVGASIPAGTILQGSPSINKQGNYMYGRECNVALMSVPGVAEDGIVVSRDLLSKFSFKTYERRVVEWGSKAYPLNMYGDDKVYKPHPDIGELVRPDGVLMALRGYDEDFEAVEISINATQHLDNVFDRATYTTSGGRVIDIRPLHDSESSVPTTPVGMEGQAMKYDEATRRYYREIIAEYDIFRRNYGDGLRLSKEFHALVEQAYSVIGLKASGNQETSDRVTKTYRGIPLDDWRMEFVIEYDITPNIGFKLTDQYGGKGVICHIAEPDEMPVDSAGNRADLIMDPNARFARQNLGGLYELYLNASKRDLFVEVKNLLGIKPQPGPINPDYLKNHPNFEAVKAKLLRWYQIAIPHVYQWFIDGTYSKPFENHLKEIIEEDVIRIHYPPDNQAYGPDMIATLETEFPSVYGPVSYVGNSGLRRTTKNPVRIGSMYIIILEKTGDDWTAVSSGKFQNFGVLAPITSRDKYTSPTRNQAIRAFGDAEVRILLSTIGPLATAEILDRNNNIPTHRSIVRSVLMADKPTNIKKAVDRDEIPLGNARPLQLVKHLALCGGWKFMYKPYVAGSAGNQMETEDEAVLRQVASSVKNYVTDVTNLNRKELKA